MRFTFIRHGESVANTAGRWQGQGDSPLSPLGEKQALALGSYLDASAYDRFVCSDLERAHQTALAVSREVEPRESWREIDVGSWEGLTHAQVAEEYPDEIVALRSGEPIAVGGGESWRDLAVRIDAALLDLKQTSATDEHVMVTAHGGVISILFAGLLGVRERHPRPLGWLVNTSISRVRFDAGVTWIEAYNTTPHLLHVEHRRDAYAPPDADEFFVQSGDSSATMNLGERIESLRQSGAPIPPVITASADQILSYGHQLLSLPGDGQHRLAPLAPERGATFRLSRTKAWLLNWNAPAPGGPASTKRA